MVPSVLCDKVNINFQTAVDVANVSLLHVSPLMTALAEEDECKPIPNLRPN